MDKRLIGTRLFASILFLVGAFNFFLGVSHPGNTAFLVIGSICVVLSIGIWKLWDWARRGLLLLSFAFIALVYVPLIIATFMGMFHGFAGMGLIVNTPVLILSLICINSLMRPEVRDQSGKRKAIMKDLTPA